MRAVYLWGVMMLMTCVAEAAESKPVDELPGDMAQWSTVWVDVPQQMYEVGKDEGPISALTWGPAKGVASAIQLTAKELWGILEPDQKSLPPSPASQPDEDDPSGVVLRYTF